MTQAKHTPGPWDCGVVVNLRCIDTDEFGFSIAWINTDNHNKIEEAKANARLIAAAPELLEALEEIVSAADGDGWSQLDADLRKARAAIAKATGVE